MEKFTSYASAIYVLFDVIPMDNEKKVTVESLPDGWYLSTVGDYLFGEDGIGVCVFNEDDEVEAQYDIEFYNYADLLSRNWIEEIATRMYNDIVKTAA